MFLRRVLSLALTACVAFFAGPSLAADAGSQSAMVNGHPIAWTFLGSGRPVLVMVSGLGNGKETFAKVAPLLAKHGTVIVYDRPGYGESPAAPSPRDAEAAASDLDALLAQTGIKGPYVVLGHSLGGLYAEAFAGRHPDKVAGLILEESRPAKFTAQCEALKAGMCTPPKALGLLMPAGGKAEMASLDAVMTQVQAKSFTDRKPVLVLSRPTADNPMDRLWRQAQGELADSYVGGKHLTAPAGGHYIHVDQQAWFLQAVTDFMGQVGP